jgi:dienelactone hydrolase
MSRSTLKLLAVALALVLALLLWTFDRAAMPKPTRDSAGEPARADVAAARSDRVGQDSPTAADVAELGGIEVREDGLVATWFAPTGAAAGPALLVLGGSEGGKQTSTRIAARLHAQGYATLALAYFGTGGLPEQLVEIPLEYFVRALDWLARQPGVDPTRLGVVGGSKGAEAALLLASRDRRVRAVIASTPSDYTWQGVDWNAWSDTPSWTEGGQPVPYLRYVPFDPAQGLRAMYDRSVAAAGVDARRSARIPLERSDAALLLIAGDDDALWGATDASRRIAAVLDAAGHPREVKVLTYPDAGHVVFVGGPLAADDPVLERILPMGGTAEGVLAAINDAWPKSLHFLDRHLKRREPSKPVASDPSHR